MSTAALLSGCGDAPLGCYQPGTARLAVSATNGDDLVYEVRKITVGDCADNRAEADWTSSIQTPSIGPLEVSVEAGWSRSDTGSGMGVSVICEGDTVVDPQADGEVVDVVVSLDDCDTHWLDG